MDRPNDEVNDFVLALTHWLEAAQLRSTDPYASSRAFDNARRHLAALFARDRLPTLKEGS
jgi:hypothetical protein